MDLDKLFERIPYDRVIPLPAWQRAGALVVVVALIMGLFYFFLVKSKDEEITGLKENLATIQKEVEDNRRYAQKLNKLKAKLVRLEVTLTKASKQLPSKKEIPELLEQITNIGIQSGLEFTTFKPKGEVRKEYYSEVPVQLKVTGKFHNALLFFDEVAHLPRIVTVNNIKMSAGKQKKGSTNLSIQCEAITYRFIEGAVNAGAKGGKKKSSGRRRAPSAPPRPGG